jgi:hypothetical protein
MSWTVRALIATFDLIVETSESHRVQLIFNQAFAFIASLGSEALATQLARKHQIWGRR